MNALALRIAPAQPLLVPALALSVLLVAAGLGPLAIAPVLGVVGLAALLAAPMRWSALGLLGLALIVDNPSERPAEGKWQSPLLPLGDLLYENLRKAVGLEVLRFSLLELLIAVLMLIVVARKLRGDDLDDALHLGALPNPMKHAFAGLLATITFLEVYGLARGGDFKQSLWQIRQLFWMPVLGVLFGHAFKSRDSRIALLRTIMLAAWVRALLGIYTKWAVFGPAGIVTEYVTTHSDTILAVVAMLIGASVLVERLSVGHLVLNLVLQPVVFLGIIANDRRVAFVSLGAGLLSLIGMGPQILRTLLRRSLLVVVPMALLYVAIGWNSSASIFKPVQTIKSVSDKDDASNQTRDIENYNLTLTLKRNPLLGQGFGHEYFEFVQAYRVDQVFAQYKFIAHNSVLWVISNSGWLGFTMLWAVFPVAVLVARRVHRKSTSAIDRTTAYGAVMAVMCFIIQAWADMGLQSWMGVLVLTSLTGATGALWTAHTRAGLSACSS